MFKKELVSLISFYAISPIHAGSSSATGAVDNPIQRERHTNWPVIQASAVKGAMRSHFRRFFKLNEAEGKEKLEKKDDFTNYIFGSDEENDNWKGDSAIPGALSVSDAKLLAFPVRSNIAPFVWVVSPAILKRLKRDLEFLNYDDIAKDLDNFEVKDEKAIAFGNWIKKGEKVILEDGIVEINETKVIPKIFQEYFDYIDKLLLISDDMFKYVVENCTEIQAQIKIDEETGTTKDGSLRYEELLPSDTLLYSVVYVSDTAENKLNAEGVLNNVKLAIKDFIQLGGDETLGRGICKIKWISNDGGDK